MKKILRKNQIMITALAVMIAVAGYLNFAGTKIGEEDFISVDGSSSELTYEISDEDMYAISLREDTDGTITDYASAAGTGQDIPSLDTDDVTITENYLNSNMDASAGNALTFSLLLLSYSEHALLRLIIFYFFVTVQPPFFCYKHQTCNNTTS